MAASSAGGARRASAHSAAQAGAGRSQLFSSAGHTCALRSADQPGNCSKPTATQRLPPAGGNVGAAAAGAVAGAGGGGGVGVVRWRNRRWLLESPTPKNTRQGLPMGLLLLEALAALVLLVFIVWWVMFAGRRKGERNEHDEREP